VLQLWSWLERGEWRYPPSGLALENARKPVSSARDWEAEQDAAVMAALKKITA
jgi:hypothetical protein